MLGLAGACFSPKVKAGATSDPCDRAIEASAGAFVTEHIADHFEKGPKNTVRAYGPWIKDYIRFCREYMITTQDEDGASVKTNIPLSKPYVTMARVAMYANDLVLPRGQFKTGTPWLAKLEAL